MQAIETYFDGRRFRSRLEARYATFFKSLDLPYQYEPEGYELNGNFYLPDFFLPTIPLWVEVKGTMPTDREWKLMGMLVGHTEQHGTIVGPLETWLGTERELHTKFFEDGAEDWPYYFCECSFCGKIGFNWEGTATRIWCCESNARSGDYSNANSPRLLQAHQSAMQARFEHGEKG